MEIRFYVLLICLFTLVSSGLSQSTFIPENLGSEINSIYDELNPVPSPDGKKIYFTRLNHPENTQGTKNTADIWVSELRKDGVIISTLHMKSLNTGKYNSVLSVSGDGNQLLIYRDKNFFLVSGKDQSWETPQKLNVKASKDATMSSDGKYIVFSKTGKLYMLEKSAAGTWGAALPLAALNRGKQTSPFLLMDNKTMYFSRDLKGKQQDIYKTERQGTDWNNWSSPIALNDTINSMQSEDYLKTNRQGSWGYYSSTNNSLGKADIFRVKLYEDNPFVEVSGTIINSVTKRPLLHLPVILLADGKRVDSVKINADSASFRVKLPIGKMYLLSAQVDHYKEYPITIDATNLREYTALKANLEEGPVSYVLLQGKLLIKNTGMYIPAKAKPTIVVDGDVSKSANINLDSGTYSIQLNHGAVYYVQVSAKRFESFPALVDFTAMDGYEQINLDLQADAEKMAIITGMVINKKTGKALTYPAAAAIEVEGVESVSAVIDSLNGNYELRLPLHLAYTISAKVSGFYPIYEIIDVSNEIVMKLNLVIVPIEKGKTVLMKNVSFQVDQATFTPSSLPEMDNLARFLIANPKIKIEISGYTSKPTKVSTLNMAKAVTKYLTSKGVPATQLFARGYGSAKSRAFEDNIVAPHIEFTFLSAL